MGGMTGKSYELCCHCGSRTGRAGKAEDSLYSINGEGPFCEGCFAEFTCSSCEGSGEVFVKRIRKGEVDYIDGSPTNETVRCDSCKGEGLRL
jgi:hypothetical protein